eukprot:TRINITY_DN64501_c0_g1_i1.p1 TRINITY_DN64501_c0_g1~~TRINITY_DN64501_c0_g1_i1.p1  ORF type:complete len:1068 (-),score=201.15 TRINITY_DN64501_c0_g1_i1:186-3086(-)
MKTLQEILEGNALFSHLEDRELNVALEAMRQVHFTKGENVITQGEQTDNSDFYVLQYGRCTMLVDGNIRTALREGDYFGEIELLYTQPRQATVRVDSDRATCWALDRSTYRHIMTGTFMKKRRLYETAMQKIPLLKSLTRDERVQLADALQPAKFMPGEYLMKFDEVGKHMFIILEGTIEVIGRDDNKNPIKVCEFGKGDHVGELEFINHHKTVADVRAVTLVRSAKLNRAHFELCMGPILELLKKNAGEDNQVYDYYNATQKGKSIKASDSTDPYAGFTFGAVGEDSVRDLVLEEADEAPEAEVESMRQKFEGRAGERRPTISSEVFDAVGDEKTFVAQTHPKTAEEKKYLSDVLSSNALFKHLDDRETAAAVDAFFPVDFKAGDEIAQQGTHGTEKDTFHVIYSGEVAIIKDGEVTGTLKPGDTWGEVELMYNQPRSATTRARTNLKTWAVDRGTYKHILTGTFIRKRALYEDFLRKIWWLAGLSTPEILQLADALQPCNVSKGEHLISCNTEGEWFYILIEGLVEVVGRDSDGNHIKVCEFKEGDCVGELEFLHNHNTVADVIAVTDTRTARLNRVHFEMCMGPIVEFLKANREKDPVFNYYNHTRKQSTIRATDANDPTAGFTFGSPPTSPGTGAQRAQSKGNLLEASATEKMAQEYSKISGKDRRKTVAAEVYDAEADEATYTPTMIEKSEEDTKWLNDVMTQISLFSHLEKPELQVAVGAMEKVQFVDTEEIVVQGEQGTAEDMFYIIKTGAADMSVDGKVIKSMSHGDYFGETDLMYPEPHRFTVKVNCKEGVSTFALNRTNYQHIISGTFIRKRRLYEDFLRRVKWLKCMTHQELLQLADALEPCSFQDGENMITYGEVGKWMYVIVEGTVKVVGRKDGEKVEVCTFTTGDCIGELEFLNDHVCVADVVAVGETRAAKLSRPHFEMCMGPVKDILRRNASEENQVYDYYNATRKEMAP